LTAEYQFLIMLGLLFFLSVASAKLHHFYVGQISSTAIHALELDDELRTLYEMGIIPTAMTSPSLAIDVSVHKTPERTSTG
jgi:TM2 domain-containing membrane protein YozV